jgi:hypothetical protein
MLRLRRDLAAKAAFRPTDVSPVIDSDSRNKSKSARNPQRRDWAIPEGTWFGWNIEWSSF